MRKPSRSEDAFMTCVTKLITAVKKLTGCSCSPLPDTSSHCIVHEFPAVKKQAAAAKARPERRPTVSPAVKAHGHAEPVPAPSVALRPTLVVSHNPVLPDFLRHHDGEVCDVCGYVNREARFACRQCDVPLPSSVF
jgi:hypothetical protein